MSFSAQKSIWHFGLLPSLLLGITLLFPLELLGAEQVAPQPEQPAPTAEQVVPQIQKSDRFNSMEAPRDYMSGKIAHFANYIDNFFGNDRHYQESNQSVVQMDLTKLNGYGSDHKFDLATRVNLSLPKTEGRLRLLVETDPENNITDQPIPGLIPTQGSTVITNKVVVPGSLALAARYATAKEDVWNFHTDWGIKFPLPPKPFVRARGSFSYPLGEWRMKAIQSVYWFNTLGAGETTELDLEHFLSKPGLFRATTTVTWLNDTQNFDMRQDLSIYQTKNDRTALLYQASAIGISNPQYQMTDFVVLLLYRYRMHEQWLFFELSPQLHFPRDRQYQYSPAINVRLEVLFDESR